MIWLTASPDHRIKDTATLAAVAILEHHNGLATDLQDQLIFVVDEEVVERLLLNIYGAQILSPKDLLRKQTLRYFMFLLLWQLDLWNLVEKKSKTNDGIPILPTYLTYKRRSMGMSFLLPMKNLWHSNNDYNNITFQFKCFIVNEHLNLLKSDLLNITQMQ